MSEYIYIKKANKVDSTCPMCRKKHKAATKWNYCKVCDYIINKNNYQDTMGLEHRVHKA